MTQLEIGYLAGIIDGEGTITLTKDKEFRFPTIAVASCTLGILEEIKRICDGGVITSKKTYKVNHSPSWRGKLNDGVQSRFWKKLLLISKNLRKRLVLNLFLEIIPV